MRAEQLKIWSSPSSYRYLCTMWPRGVTSMPRWIPFVARRRSSSDGRVHCNSRAFFFPHLHLSADTPLASAPSYLFLAPPTTRLLSPSHPSSFSSIAPLSPISSPLSSLILSLSTFLTPSSPSLLYTSALPVPSLPLVYPLPGHFASYGICILLGS